MRTPNRSIRTGAMLLSFVALAARPAAAADALTQAQARAAIEPFYKALSAATGDEIAALVKQAASPQWLSCGGNDACRNRDEVIGGIVGLHRAVPDLKWEIRDVLVAGNAVIVRGEASGTPRGEFMDVGFAGKGFKVMSIDVHTIEGGRM